MMRGITEGPLGVYARTVLAARMAALRDKVSRRDLGASAIELAIITAIIGLVALGLALLIQHVVATKKATIGGL